MEYNWKKADHPEVEVTYDLTDIFIVNSVNSNLKVEDCPLVEYKICKDDGCSELAKISTLKIKDLTLTLNLEKPIDAQTLYLAAFSKGN